MKDQQIKKENPPKKEPLKKEMVPKKLKQNEIAALLVPADVGLSMAKANKILRDIDRDYGFKLQCSDIIGQWAFYKD